MTSWKAAPKRIRRGRKPASLSDPIRRGGLRKAHYLKLKCCRIRRSNNLIRSADGANWWAALQCTASRKARLHLIFFVADDIEAVI